MSPSAISLNEALQDKETLYELRHHPETFRFQNGVTLNLAVKHAPPHTIVDEGEGDSLTVSGPTGDIIKILAKSLDFQYVLAQPPDRAWGSALDNGSWTGLIGMVLTGAADIAVVGLCQTPQRSEVVDFAWPVKRISGKIIALKEGTKIDPWGVFFSLTVSVWVGLAFSLLALWMVFLLLENDRSELSKPWSVRAVNALLKFIRILLQQDDNSYENSLWKRYLLGAWACLVAVLGWSFKGNLIALLATRHIGLPIQTLQDVVDHPSMGLILHKHSVFASTIAQAKSGGLKEVSNLREKGRILYIERSQYEWAIENFVSRGTHVILTGNNRADTLIKAHYSKTGRCDLYIAKETILPYGCSYILKKGSPLLPALNYRLGLLENGGFYQGMGRDITANASACKKVLSKITVKEAFSVTSILGILIVLFIGMTLAAFIFFLELIVGRGHL